MPNRCVHRAGYEPDDPNIKVMSHTDSIEVWLVSVTGTDMYVPYHLLLPTDSGLLSATKHHCESKGTAEQLNRSVEGQEKKLGALTKFRQVR